MERTRFIGNTVEATGSGSFVMSGALNGFFQGSTVRIEDVEVQGSLLLAGTPFGGAGATLDFLSSTQATLDRFRLVDNTATVPAEQALLSVQNSSFVLLRDVLVAQGEIGMFVASASDAMVLLSQVTATGHTGVGLELDETGTGSISLVNSIVFGNGTDVGTVGTPAIFPANLVGIDPLFTNAAGGDYTLAAGSPAEDAGDIAFSGIGPYDLGHGARVVGPETDLGAYERGALFNDGFENGNTGVWSW